MAVIIPKMDMPNDCLECDFRSPISDNCHLVSIDVMENRVHKTRNDKCPLRSVDGLISRIEAYKDKFCVTNSDSGEGFDIDNQTVDKVIDIIKEYCKKK